MANIVPVTRDQQDRLLNLLKEGLPLKLAAASAGVSAAALRRWLQFGERVAAGAVEITEPGAQEAYTFWSEVARIMADHAGEVVRLVREKAESGHFQAMTWLYEQYTEAIEPVFAPARQGDGPRAVAAVVFNMPDGESYRLEVEGGAQAVLRDRGRPPGGEPPSLPGPGADEP